MEKRKPRQLYSKLFWTYTVIVLVIVSALTVYFITVSRKNVLESDREELERINISCADYIDEMSETADYFYKDLYRSRSKLDDLLAYMELALKLISGTIWTAIRRRGIWSTRAFWIF